MLQDFRKWLAFRVRENIEDRMWDVRERNAHIQEATDILAELDRRLAENPQPRFRPNQEVWILLGTQVVCLPIFQVIDEGDLEYYYTFIGIGRRIESTCYATESEACAAMKAEEEAKDGT